MVWIAIALLGLLSTMLFAVVIFAALGFGQMKKDIGFKLPSFNLFTGRWSDEEKKDKRAPEG